LAIFIDNLILYMLYLIMIWLNYVISSSILYIYTYIYILNITVSNGIYHYLFKLKKNYFY